ncbi:AraC family ligand binding domain-containing protein [Novosphingobium sp.]|uniref:AraC family ligand binding domain-containing protein n=1 Tax=Novosphingobium sp. TaxID=1874826 RepID=UPI003BAA13FD
MSLTAQLIDARTVPEPTLEVWPIATARGLDIQDALARLADGPPGADGRREIIVAHPYADPQMPGLAPAIEVRFGILLPGEQTKARRSNASSFSMALAGGATKHVGVAAREIMPRDSWTTPAMQIETLKAAPSEAFHYVTFSNAPFLQKINALYRESNPPADEDLKAALEQGALLSAHVTRAKEVAGGPISLGAGYGQLLPYEHLIDPEAVANPPLHWPWADLAQQLGIVRNVGKGYTGRPLWCLYNPATERRNGTTQSFFATVTSAPANATGNAHRHMSAAINLILDGSGYSIVGGQRVDWAAGDIMLSAPGWAVHGHSIGPEGAVILTIQDHPLHIGSESLIWQENVDGGPILTLGSEAGFQTNLADVRGRN